MSQRLNPISRHRQRCGAVRLQMSDFLDGELERGEAARVRRHVRWCPNCRRMLANLRRAVSGLQRLAEPADLDT